MKKGTIFTSFLLVMLAIVAFSGTAAAAPKAAIPTVVTGTIDSIKVITDTETNVTTVRVKLLDSTDKLITVHVSVETALLLNLVALDPITNLPVVNETMIAQVITIEPSQIIEDDPDTIDGEHPVATLLAKYFNIEYETVFGYHEDGFGFGVIAQTLWMANKLGDITLADKILAAKLSGDYSAFTLPDNSTPTNWGQLRKAVMGHDAKANPGQVISGKAEPLPGEVVTDEPETTLSNNVQVGGNQNANPANQGKKGNTLNSGHGKAPKNKKP